VPVVRAAGRPETDVTEDTDPRDERRIIEELEQLQHAITVSRTRREEAQRQFARHLESLGSSRPAESPGSAAPPATPPPPATTARPPLDPDLPASVPPPSPEIARAGANWQQLFANESEIPAPQAHARAAGPAARGHVSSPPARVQSNLTHAGAVARGSHQSPADVPGIEEPALPPDLLAEAAAARARTIRMAGMGAAVVAAVALLGAFLMPGKSPDPAATTPEPAPVAAPAETAAPPPEPAPPAAPVSVTVTTTRNVWLRLTVDGEVRLEREVPAGQHYALGGQRLVIVRAGDAGAVQVSQGGGPAAPLGGDGQVLTRRFAAAD
jgi:hypothetical protein